MNSGRTKRNRIQLAVLSRCAGTVKRCQCRPAVGEESEAIIETERSCRSCVCRRVRRKIEHHLDLANRARGINAKRAVNPCILREAGAGRLREVLNLRCWR